MPWGVAAGMLHFSALPFLSDEPWFTNPQAGLDKGQAREKGNLSPAGCEPGDGPQEGSELGGGGGGGGPVLPRRDGGDPVGGVAAVSGGGSGGSPDSGG